MLPLRTRVNRIKDGAILILVCLICIFSASSAFSQTNLPNPIRLGIRTAAFPIGHVLVPEDYDVATNRIIKPGEYDGFCNLLKQKLESYLNLKGIHPNITVVPVNIENQYRGKGYPRFDGLVTNKIDIECGPNSLSSLKLLDTKGKPIEDKVDYAPVSFYRTGIKLLLKEDEAKKLDNQNEIELENRLRALKIGVIQRTTTLQQFESDKGRRFYPNYIPFDAKDERGDARDSALDALELPASDQNSIQAFASDAVILRTLLKEGVEDNLPYRKYRKPYELRGYTLFPRKPGDYLFGETENYIIAIQRKPGGYSADKLKKLITDVLKQKKWVVNAQKEIENYEFGTISLFERWKGFLPYLLYSCIAAVIVFFIVVFIKRKKEKNKDMVSPQPPSSSSGQSNYKFGSVQNLQINERGSSGTQNNNNLQPEIWETLNDFKQIVADLQQKYPRASEQQATTIIDAEFEEIRHNQPQRGQNLLSLKRLWNGVKKGSLKVGEHFAEETPWGKAAIGFLEGVTDDIT
ncbi:hypothetical protein [Nostoc sp. 106C]|uniref:hypothetical protein n=1 Tax=Nostoc sp. 106C TaxID=1932667 RepID=UPI0011806D59|nr:hypothetical protein [Nostoc sp. 106C]